MKLKQKYAKMDDVPAGFEDLYKEVDGEAVLVGVEGFSIDDADRLRKLQADLRKARKEAADAKKGSGAFSDVLTHEALGDGDEHDADAVASALDELQNLRDAKGTPNDDEKAIAERIEREANRKLAPVQRELDKTKKELLAVTGERDTLQTGVTQRSIIDELTVVGQHDDFKLQPHVLADSMSEGTLFAERAFERDETNQIVTRDGLKLGGHEIPAGIPVREALDLIKREKLRPHWFPTPEGMGSGDNLGGGGGGGGDEGACFSHAGWNVTKQMQLEQKLGAEKTKSIAAKHGVDLDHPVRPQPAAAK